MTNLEKSNKVLKKDNCSLVYINIPTSCIYDISNIIIEQDYQNNEIRVVSDEIPIEIKKNMTDAYNGNLESFVKHIEENLEIYLSGKKPISIDTKNIDTIEDKIKMLPDKFIFPTQKIHTNILKMDCQKKGILFLIAKKINIQVSCAKCKSILSLEEPKYCQCKTLLKYNYICNLDNESLGSLFLDNSTFLHLNPSNFQFNCENCFCNYQSNKIGINMKFKMNCYKCNTLLSFCIKNVTFLEKKTKSFTINTELPNKGACKHYKKSYRWFRFSCCNSVYPCDICHDAENSHSAQIANKMICGFCSREQSVKTECFCGMNLKKHTAFWEGGKGSRNKATMSRKDTKKFSRS